MFSCGVLGGDTLDGYGSVRVSFRGSGRNVTQTDKDGATLRVYFNSESIERKGGVFEKFVKVGTHLKITAEAISTDGRVIGKGEENIIVKDGRNNVQMRIFTYDNFVVTIDGKATGYTNFVDAWNAANGQTATIKMNADATANTVTADQSGMTTIFSGSITLDLNGHTLTGDKNAVLPIIRMGQTATFTLKDSGSEGKITGGIGGITVEGGNFIMESGTMSGNDGPCIYIAAAATFTMTGGTITDNIGPTDNGGGAIVKGTFNMTGGMIIENETAGRGGGVYVDSTGKFTMSGGVISGNTAKLGYPDGDGGGVYVKTGGTFTQNGGSVTGNSPDDVIRGI